jgi:hypothetical protein
MKTELLLLLLIGGLFVPKKVSALAVNPVQAISNTRPEFMPYRIGNEPVPTLYLKGCRGERVQAAFYLSDIKPVEQLMVKSEWPEVCDLRWIKWWWQAGRTVMESDRSQYIPELLLHDGNLVKSSPRVVDVNTYPEVPQDAATLQPLDCADDGMMVGFEQGVLLTVTIPENVVPGDFPFLLHVTAKGLKSVIVPIHLTVYPFDLPKPKIDYSIYYRARLSGLDPGLSPEFRTAPQMLADLRCMVEHGITNPNTYNGEGALEEVLRLRTLAGCDNRRLFTGVPAGPSVCEPDFDRRTWAQLKVDYENIARRMNGKLRALGVEEFYLGGKDEGQATEIWKQAPVWRAVRAGGGKIMCAASGLSEKAIMAHLDDLQDVIVRAGTWPTQECIDAVRGAGKRTYVYGHIGAQEDPVGERRSKGLLAWIHDVDGMMDYCWMHVWPGSKHPWDDFGRTDHWRSHMYSYPTLDGCIPTLQLEGFAAGVNDGRYLLALENAMNASRNSAVKQEARKYIDYLHQEADTVDLDAMRYRVAELTVALQ